MVPTLFPVAADGPEWVQPAIEAVCAIHLHLHNVSAEDLAAMMGVLITARRADLQGRSGLPAACPWRVTERAEPAQTSCGMRASLAATCSLDKRPARAKVPLSKYFDVQPLLGARRIHCGYLAARPLPHAD